MVRHGEYPTQPHPRRDVAALRDAGFEVDVICDSEPGRPHFERVEGVTVIRVPMRHKRGRTVRYLLEYTGMPWLAAGALALRSLGRRYEYVEIDTMPTWLLAASLVPKLLGAKVVLYMFEHMAELTATDRNLPESHPLIRALDTVEMACVRLSDRVLTPAERNRELYVERGVAPNKVVFIPNCPDEPVFLANLPAIQRRSVREEKEEFRLVTHGSLLERYGIQILIEAVAKVRDRLPGVKLDIIGSGEYEPELKALVGQIFLDDVVTFTGPVQFEDMATHLLRADVGVAPYLLDLLPNKVMEYLLLGIPTIASDWPTLRRYFGDNAVTYVPPTDVDALAHAIEAMYKDPVKRREQAAIARELYLNTLAWSRTKADYLAVYGAPPTTTSETDGGHTHQTWLPFVLGQSRGPRNALTRLPTIVRRFGVTSRKSERHFQCLLEITNRYSVRPTLPVTAVTARRNPDVIHRLRDRGVEVAAHGYVHNDFSALSAQEQGDHVLRARDELAALGLPVRGWRCPYSRWNDHTLAALKTAGFEYDATPVYEWPALEQEGIQMTPTARADYARLCALFNVRDATTRAVLPTKLNGMLQIPMSIPQDEDMVDRLHLRPEEMSRVWLRILTESRNLGETFVICLHPERASLCADPLEATLFEARRTGDVWIAMLGEISDWWTERQAAQVEVEADGHEGRWRVRVHGTDRVAAGIGNRKQVGAGVMEVDAERKPVVLVGPEWPDAICHRLREAGYVFERGASNGDHSGLELSHEFSPEQHPDQIVRGLAAHRDSVVRLNPWPDGFKSCLSVTGDIDALTLFDFAMRLKEFS